MKKFYFTSIIALSLLWVNFSFAQNVVEVPPFVPDALFNAVSSASAGDILVLADGGIYPNSATLPVSVPLTIKTADGAAAKAKIVSAADASGGYAHDTFQADASLTLRNIIINGQHGTIEATGGNMINRGTIGAGGILHIDGCEIYRYGHISQGGDVDTLIVENSVLYGNVEKAGGWGAEMDMQGDIVKYVRVQNNTVIMCIFGPYLGTGWGNYSPPERLTETVIIDHNTMYNLTGAHGPTTMFNRTQHATITNNLYINGTFRPNEFFSDKFIDFPNNADDITDFTNVISHLGPKGMWIMDVSMIDSAGTVIDMQANNIAFTSEVMDAWTSRGLEKPYVYTNEMKSGISDPDNSYFEEEVKFVDAPKTPMFAIEKIADYCVLGNADPTTYEGETPYQGWDWYDGIDANYDLREASEINMAYNTDAKSYNSGINGYPLGDLNWFPELKAKWEKGEVVAIKDSEVLPAEYNLTQNYPNPFNPTTKIEFSIPKSELVTLKVFNVLGQEVAQILNQQMSSGTYTVDFDASNLTSGMYIYTIKAGSFQNSKKMILMK